jgi:hypothetical protein
MEAGGVWGLFLYAARFLSGLNNSAERFCSV